MSAVGESEGQLRGSGSVSDVKEAKVGVAVCRNKLYHSCVSLRLVVGWRVPHQLRIPVLA